jgi:hypothetical protein
MTNSILDLIQGSMLVSQEADRISAEDLEHEMKKLLNTCEKNMAEANPYAMPPYFYPALDKEHDITVSQMLWRLEDAKTDNEPPSQPPKPAIFRRKSRRYKSSRFIQATKEP